MLLLARRENDEAGHLLQFETVSFQYVPASHSKQTVRAAFEKDPTGHAMHSMPFPRAFLYFPGSHRSQLFPLFPAL